MAKTNKPLAIVLQPDVPPDAADLLEAMGHLLYTPAQAVQAGVTKIDAVAGAKCWRMHETWWVKDGALSAHAKLMLKAATTAAYPDTKPKAKGRKR